MIFAFSYLQLTDTIAIIIISVYYYCKHTYIYLQPEKYADIIESDSEK